MPLIHPSAALVRIEDTRSRTACAGDFSPIECPECHWRPSAVYDFRISQTLVCSVCGSENAAFLWFAEASPARSLRR